MTFPEKPPAIQQPKAEVLDPPILPEIDTSNLISPETQTGLEFLDAETRKRAEEMPNVV